MDATTCLYPDSIYPFSALRRVKGWFRSGFNQQTTEMNVRRVSAEGSESVQIEITIREFKGKGDRMYTHCGGMVLDPQQTDALIKALSEVKVYREAKL